MLCQWTGTDHTISVFARIEAISPERLVFQAIIEGVGAGRKPVNERRRWTDEEKATLLEEAEQPGSSYSEVGRRHGIPTNLLFCWRKALRGETTELQKMLATLEDLEREVNPLLAELRTARKQGLSPLNAINSFAALSNAVCKLQITKVDLIERLSEQSPLMTGGEQPETPADPKMERAAERLLVSVVKKQLAHDLEVS